MRETLQLKPDLTSLPERMKFLPIDPRRKIPVPWFVAWVDGQPEFRAMDAAKWIRAVREKLCWVCGGRLGAYLAFTIGPMCGVTRTTSEPPSHGECAHWSARNCPFLSRPWMVRREDRLPEEMEGPGGFALERNPGVTLIWVTRSFKVWRDDRTNKPLITVGDPEAIEFYAEGRQATRAEIDGSIATGLPFLMELAERDGPEAVAELRRQVKRLEKMLPAG